MYRLIKSLKIPSSQQATMQTTQQPCRNQPTHTKHGIRSRRTERDENLRQTRPGTPSYIWTFRLGSASPGLLLPSF